MSRLHQKKEKLKILIRKQALEIVPKLTEPNEEVQMDFAGPIPFGEHKQNYHILLSVDRLIRFPRAQVYKDCDTETALNYLEEYCRINCILCTYDVIKHRLLKPLNLNFSVKNRNIKLIVAIAGNHRATGMIERLLQTIKRKVAVMAPDPLWSSADLAKIMESIELIPISTTRIKPSEAHYGGPTNTEF